MFRETATAIIDRAVNEMIEIVSVMHQIAQVVSAVEEVVSVVSVLEETVSVVSTLCQVTEVLAVLEEHILAPIPDRLAREKVKSEDQHFIIISLTY